MDMNDRCKKERTFALALPAFVQTEDGRVAVVAEQAEVAAVSADEAMLRLRTRVQLGMKLRFVLHVPRTFFLGNPLQMSLSGTVVQIQPSYTRAEDLPLVRLRLDRAYAIDAHHA